MSDSSNGRASGNDSSSRDKTFTPERTESLQATTAASRAAKEPLDATFVPTATAAGPSEPRGSSTKSADTTSTGSPPKKTTTLGKYKLLKELGQGGMGKVFLGEDTKLGRKAAIKILSSALAGQDDFVTRFYKEARAMARVHHECTVSVYDVDQDPDRGIHYVAMEFVDGKSMQKWMDALKKLSVGDALHVTLRCAEALQFAHGQNLIHRDIKPDNIMLTSSGKVKVADFGLAKATDEDLSMTASGTGLGTPYYMAPEQARNAKHVDGRADIYALGVMLYYFVTGKLPFSGNSAVEVITAKEAGRYESARKLNPQVPDKLDLMIAKMIEKDADRRFKDCQEVIQMLAGLGLENPSLSFIEGSVRVNPSSGAPAPSRLAATTAMPARPAAAAVPRTSNEDAARQAATAPGAPQWIVQYKTPQGKETLGRFTTPQVIAAMKAGVIDNKAKLKKNAADAFMPLAFYPEFEKAVEGRLVREKAEQKSAGLKSEFAKIGRQYDRRGWVRWIKGFLSNAAGLVSLAIWLIVVFGGLGALIFFREPIWNAFANFMNSFQKS
ncbi:serine/threonine protein kinase [Schlesneria paludicola]|uniref:serine/threonine protein kinase n=1 Tax=Schlesneria paludicola TaxID=360056 RepID=UPI00029ADB36|nr:serine/threonine-protein kinase [Schlesneria paludicola]